MVKLLKCSKASNKERTMSDRNLQLSEDDSRKTYHPVELPTGLMGVGICVTTVHLVSNISYHDLWLKMDTVLITEVDVGLSINDTALQLLALQKEYNFVVASDKSLSIKLFPRQLGDVQLIHDLVFISKCPETGAHDLWIRDLYHPNMLCFRKRAH
jgi:hypothetical protein